MSIHLIFQASTLKRRLVIYKRSSKKESIAYMDEPIVVDDNATNDESEIESNDNVYESDTEDAAVQTENDIEIEIVMMMMMKMTSVKIS